MFLENELNGTLTFLHILVALLFGIAPVALTIAIKMTLYRRRLAEDAAHQLGKASASEPVASNVARRSAARLVHLRTSRPIGAGTA